MQFREEVLCLRGHIGEVRCVAFTPEGTRLATCGFDHNVKIWDALSGQELLTLKGHTQWVLALAFNPDGTRLVSGGRDQSIRIWDARPPTPAVQTEREAVGLLDSLFARPLPAASVVAYLRTAPAVPAATCQLALSLAERYREETDPKKYHAAAWPVLRNPDANVFTCRFALAQMTAACERAPDNTDYRHALGIAQYRLGKFERKHYSEALATLTRCEAYRPAALAFLAMARHQLGEKEQAQAIVARLREVMKRPEWAGNADAEAFRREAADLVAGGPGQPRP